MLDELELEGVSADDFLKGVLRMRLLPTGKLSKSDVEAMIGGCRDSDSEFALIGGTDTVSKVVESEMDNSAQRYGYGINNALRKLVAFVQMFGSGKTTMADLCGRTLSAMRGGLQACPLLRGDLDTRSPAEYFGLLLASMRDACGISAPEQLGVESLNDQLFWNEYCMLRGRLALASAELEQLKRRTADPLAGGADPGGDSAAQIAFTERATEALKRAVGRHRGQPHWRRSKSWSPACGVVVVVDEFASDSDRRGVVKVWRRYLLPLQEACNIHVMVAGKSPVLHSIGTGYGREEDDCTSPTGFLHVALPSFREDGVRSFLFRSALEGKTALRPGDDKDLVDRVVEWVMRVTGGVPRLVVVATKKVRSEHDHLLRLHESGDAAAWEAWWKALADGEVKEVVSLSRRRKWSRPLVHDFLTAIGLSITRTPSSRAVQLADKFGAYTTIDEGSDEPVLLFPAPVWNVLLSTFREHTGVEWVPRSDPRRAKGLATAGEQAEEMVLTATILAYVLSTTSQGPSPALRSLIGDMAYEVDFSRGVLVHHIPAGQVAGAHQFRGIQKTFVSKDGPGPESKHVLLVPPDKSTSPDLFFLLHLKSDAAPSSALLMLQVKYISSPLQPGDAVQELGKAVLALENIAHAWKSSGRAGGSTSRPSSKTRTEELKGLATGEDGRAAVERVSGVLRPLFRFVMLKEGLTGGARTSVTEAAAAVGLDTKILSPEQTKTLLQGKPDEMASVEDVARRSGVVHDARSGGWGGGGGGSGRKLTAAQADASRLLEMMSFNASEVVDLAISHSLAPHDLRYPSWKRLSEKGMADCYIEAVMLHTAPVARLAYDCGARTVIEVSGLPTRRAARVLDASRVAVSR